jgi:predicted lipoprotein
LVTEIQMISGQKIGIPLGKGVDAAKPHQAEQWRSGRSLQDIKLNTAALRQALLGDPAGSVIALVSADAAGDMRAKLTAALDAADQAIPGVVLPLDLAVTDDKAGRPQTQALLVKINQLRDVLTNDLPKAAGITLGFNDLDGDGG